MKKLGLKPLGDLRGKFGMGWLFIGLIMAFCVSACSDDDDTVAPVFPAKQTIYCNVGDTKEVSFDANTSWQLTSSATWCRFVVDGEEEYSLSGDAGKQNITLKVTDEAQQNDGISTAQLTLIMGDGRATIADVVRSAEGYELKIYNEAGEEIHQIEVGYDDYVSFKVKANFRFAATNRPDWVEVAGGSIVGAVNKEVVGKVKIIQNGQIEKRPIEGSDANQIIFSDENGKAFFPFQVVYKGMKPELLEVTKPTSNVWGWTVTLDGKNFTQTSTNGTSGASSTAYYKYGVPFTLKALNDEYRFVYIEKGVDWQGNPLFWFDGTDWMRVEADAKDKGKVRIMVDPFTPEAGGAQERTGYVLAFSRAVYDAFDGNFSSLIVNGDIAYEYEQANLLIEFTQKEEKKEDTNKVFLVTNTFWQEEYGKVLDCVNYTGGDAGWLKTNYNVTDIYELAQPTKSMNVKAFFNITEAKSYSYDKLEEVAGVLEGGAEPDMVSVFIGEQTEDIFIVLHDAEGNGKMLIIRINN